MLWFRTAAIVLAGVLIGAGRLQHAGHARRGPTEALLTPRRSMPHFFYSPTFGFLLVAWEVVAGFRADSGQAALLYCAHVLFERNSDICKNERLRPNSYIFLYVQVVPRARVVYCRGLWWFVSAISCLGLYSARRTQLRRKVKFMTVTRLAPASHSYCFYTEESADCTQRLLRRWELLVTARTFLLNNYIHKTR